MLISEAGQLELVEANLLDFGYRATPVLPEMGGKACETPLAQIFVGPVSIRVHPRPR
jgi:hypothetical protein